MFCRRREVRGGRSGEKVRGERRVRGGRSGQKVRGERRVRGGRKEIERKEGKRWCHARGIEC